MTSFPKDKVLRNNFATRMFREVADMDYISARTLFRNDCNEQFLVLAHQCIEKYLKGILLFNDIKHNKPTHKLANLVSVCEDIDHVTFTKRTKDFLEEIDEFDKLRYAIYMFGAYSARRTFLIELDHAVMDIRRFCIADERLARALSKTSCTELIKITKRGINMHGLLEKVQSGKNKKHKILRSNLIWKNMFFGPRWKIHNFQHGFWAKGSGFTPQETLEAYWAVKGYIHAPKEVEHYFENKG